MKTPLQFNYSDRFGVGFLMIYGGIPQFSIAWEGNFEPQRMTLAEAENVKLLIDGVPVSSYEFHESWNKCEMTLREPQPQAEPQENDGNQQVES